MRPRQAVAWTVIMAWTVLIVAAVTTGSEPPGRPCRTGTAVLAYTVGPDGQTVDGAVTLCRQADGSYR